jgi:signal peptidase I
MADHDDHPRGAAPDDPERLFTSSSAPPPAAAGVGSGDASGSTDRSGPTDGSAPTDAAGAPGTTDASGATDAAGASDGTGAAHAADRSGPAHPEDGSDGRRAGPADGAGRRPAKGGSFLRELPVLLLIAFVLAFLLRTFVLQVFYIPSSSMEPTLQIDDRMVVEKLTYLAREPQRGEIVVFEGETLVDPYAGQGTVARVVRGVGQFLGVVPASARDFVKRVIGVEGDEVVIESGQVYVNGESIDEPYVVFDDGSDYGPVTVPEGHLFFLGDNRPNSSDSRRSLGFVPRDHVVGRAAVIIWPPDHAGRLTGVEHEVPAPPGGADGAEGPVTDGEGEDRDDQAAGGSADLDRAPSPVPAAG